MFESMFEWAYAEAILIAGVSAGLGPSGVALLTGRAAIDT
jgi:hypothetical protein